MALNQGKFDKNVVKYQLEVLNVTWTAGIHGFGKENEFDTTEGLSNNKWNWIKCRLFLTDKNYRKALFPRLGSKKILYPVCIFVHWIKLIFTGLFRRIKIIFKLLFRKNKKKDLYKKLGI